MKNRSILFLLAFCLILPLTANAYTADYMSKSENFKGNVHVGPAKSPSFTTNAWQYLRHEMTFESESKDKTGQAFCVYPSFSAATDNPVNCWVVPPREWPQVYYIVYNYWDELRDNRNLSDYVMRTAGVFDRAHMINVQNWYACGGDEGCIKQLQEIQRQQNISGTTEQGGIAEAAFIISHQHNVQGNNNVDANYAFHDVSGNAVARGNEILQEAWNARGDTEQWPTPSYQVNVGGSTGQILKGTTFTLVPSPDMPNENKVGYYNIMSNDGTNVGDICVKSIKGASEVISWDGVNGQIKVTADANCKAEVKIERGTCPSGGGNTTRPRPVTCPSTASKKCKKVSEVTKTVSQCIGGYTCPQGKEGTCYCTSGQYEDVTKVIGHTTSYTCIPQNMNCSIAGGGWTEASAKEDKDTQLNTDYATEPSDLELSDYVGQSDENIENGIVKTVQTPDTRQDLALYYCEIGGQNAQSYIVVVDGGAKDDTFELKINCDSCCDVVNHSNVAVAKDIHNCCEDGVESFARQAALDELFCDDPTLSVAGYKPKCNADDYKDSVYINGYCKQYCSETIQYKIPPPTRAKSDAYFYFSKTKDKNNQSYNFTGPIFQKYKRCRTLIAYDKFNADYKSTATNINDAYTNYQKAIAYVSLWQKLDQKATGSASTAASDAKTTMGNVDISCSYTNTYKYKYWDEKWEGTYSCGTRRNPKTCNCTNSDHDHEGCEDNGSDKWSTGHTKGFELTGTVPGNTVRVYNESTENNNYPYASYTIGGGDWAPKLVNANNKLGVSGYSYNKSDVDGYDKKIDEALNSLRSETNTDKYNNRNTCEGRSCEVTSQSDVTCSSNFSYPQNVVDPATQISSIQGTANDAEKAYKSYVSQLKDLQAQHDVCGGAFTIDQTGTEKVNSETIKNRISFEQEPEMQFHYYQEYMNEETNQMEGQVIAVPFNYVDASGEVYESNTVNGTKHCIYEFKSSLTESRDGWDRFDDMTGWKEDNYSTNDLPMKHLNMYNYSEDITYQKLGEGFKSNGGVYVADRKYTTDAVGHMTCRWSDSKKNITYNLIPNGLVVIDPEIHEGDLKDLGRQYTCMTGTYGWMKYSRVGRLEVYYTLKNIGEPFDDLIHEASPSCSGRTDLAINGEPTNLTCYIDNSGNGFWEMDCPPGVPTECCNAGVTVCGVGGNCLNNCAGMRINILLEYKEIDPNNPFPNKEQYKDYKGYAWNWYEGPNGEETLTKITNDAKQDKTYSPDNITYSFTLKPSDIRAIRAYNKAMIKEGGYGNFDMICDNLEKDPTCPTPTGRTVQHCRSKFLTAISNGETLKYTGGEIKLNTYHGDIEETRKHWETFAFDANGMLIKK